MTWLWPNGLTTRPRYGSPLEYALFGPRNIGKGFHDGVDFGNYFTNIQAVSPGVVSRVERWNGSPSMQHGNRVYVDHGGGVVSSYSHLRTIAVREGQRVSAGTILGTMGATGFTTGAHLHLEVRVNGRLVDPVSFLTAKVGGGSPAGGETQRRQEGDGMYVRGTTVTNVVYKVWTDTMGVGRIRTCGVNEAAFAVAGGLVIVGTDATLTALGVELFHNQQRNPVGQQAWIETTVSRPDGKVHAIQELADAKSIAMRIEEKVDAMSAGLTDAQAETIAVTVSASLLEAGVGGASPEQVTAIVGKALSELTLRAV